jgi:scaffold protein (connect acetoacetyl-CoA thiolase and HMG-CoA synthase)
MEVPKHWREIPHRYRMEAGKCKSCNYIAFPKRIVCPECGSKDFAFHKLSGKGKLVTYTIIRTPPEGFVDQSPYAVGIIELEDGKKIMGQVTDCDPEDLKIGDQLITKFRRMNEEGKTGMIMYSYKFVPDNGV